MLDGMSEEQFMEWAEYYAAEYTPAPSPDGSSAADNGNPADRLIAERLQALAGQSRQRALAHAKQ